MEAVLVFQYPIAKLDYRPSGIKIIDPIAIIHCPTLTVPTWDGAATEGTTNTVTLIGNINGIHLNIMAAITDPSTVMDMGTTKKEGITTKVIMAATAIDEAGQPHRI